MTATDGKEFDLLSSDASETREHRNYQQIEINFDPALHLLWTYLKPNGIPCSNPGILDELHHSVTELEKTDGKYLHDGVLYPIDFLVLASKTPQIFSLGGDLSLFLALIKQRDRQALMNYAKLCIDCVYSRMVNYKSRGITISLVQGDALGGGFEMALASQIIIAERGVRMGFPEIIFNLFPGMGAYSFLARKVGRQLTERILSSGNTYKAEDLEKMGIVDIIVPPGEGTKAVYDFIRKHASRMNGLKAILECRKYCLPISYQELIDITTLWVDAALQIRDRDLQMMHRLVRSQWRQQRRSHPNSTESDKGMNLAAA